MCALQGVEVKAVHVRNHILLFVNCLVENPAFGSQTKDVLTTQAKDFGSSPILSEKFIKAVLSSGIVDRVLAWARFKATTDLQKATGTKRGASKFLGLPKLDDANHAGTSKGPVSSASVTNRTPTSELTRYAPHCRIARLSSQRAIRPSHLPSQA